MLNIKHSLKILAGGALLLVSGFTDIAYAAPPAVNALPEGGQIVAGSATITSTSTPSTAVLNVNQTSQRAVVSWNTFNVGSNATVNFNQPNNSASTLNKITSGTPSQIYGQIHSNGEVILQNQAGVYFSKSASLDVGSVTATTMNINNSDYMNGNYTFNRNGSIGKVVNNGSITTNSTNGYVALLAPEVRNGGIIMAHMGTVVMAAGEQIVLNFTGGQNLSSITTTPAAIKTLIINKRAGVIDANNIILSAEGLNTLVSGVIKQNGTLSASSENNQVAMVGGRILIQGDDVALGENSQTVATGNAGGGQITVNAAQTIQVKTGAIVNSSAVKAGNGGTIVTNAPNINLDGQFISMGGIQSGNGGLINTISTNLLINSNTYINAGAQSATGDPGYWVITTPGLTLDKKFTSLIASTLNTTNVTFKALKNFCYAYGGCSLKMSGAINVSADAAIQKTSAVATLFTLDTEGALSYGGHVNSNPSAPLDIILQSSNSVIITSTAQLAARQMKISAPTIEEDGSLLAYGGSDGSMPFMALLGARIVISGNLRSGTRQNPGQIRLEGNEEVDIKSGAFIEALGDQGGLITILSSSGTISMNHATIQTNAGNGRGGSIYIAAANDAYFTDVIFQANGTTGGGLITVIADNGDVNFQQSFIQTNGGAGVGGSIFISGVNSTLISSTEIDATGYTQGGTIKVGNDATKYTIPFSNYTSIDSFSALSTNQTDPNPSNFDGGYIETSGNTLNLLSSINVGRGGVWLVDPRNVTIASSSSSGSSFNSSGSSYTFTPNQTSTILASSIVTALNAGTSVTITTGNGGSDAGNIIVNAAIVAITANNTSLTLTPANQIQLNANITTSGAQIYSGSVVLGANIALIGSSINFSSTVSDAGNYALTITGNAVFNGAVSSITNLSISGTTLINTSTISTSGTQTYKGNITLGNSTVLSASGFIFPNNISASGSYALTLQPYGATNPNFASAQDFTNLSLMNLTKLVIGSQTNTQNITLPGSSVSVAGAITVYGGNITVNANLSDTQATANAGINLLGAGVFALGTNASINTTNANIVVTGSQIIINNISSSAISDGGANNYWQIWSTNANPYNSNTSLADKIGNLAYDYKQYNISFGSNTLVTGNGLLYSYAPTLSVVLSGKITKVYDGTTTATLAPSNYSILLAVGGDSINYNSPTLGSYYSSDVGSSIQVSVNNLTITSAISTSNKPVYGYQITSSNITGNIGTITPKAVTVSITNTGVTKVYDGGTSSNITPTYSYSGLLTGDSITLTNTGASYNSKDVTSATTVTVAGLAISAASGTTTPTTNDYSINTSATVLATITPKAVTLTGLSVPSSKVYDGTATAVVSGTASLLTKEVVGLGTSSDGKAYTIDTVTVSGTPTGTYNSNDVGIATTVSFAGLSLSNTNYSIATYTQAATITPIRILLKPESSCGDYGGCLRVIVDKVVVTPIKALAEDTVVPKLTIEAKPEIKPDAKPEVNQPAPEGNRDNAIPKDSKDNIEVTNEEAPQKRAAPITPEIIKLLNMYVSVPDGCNAHDDSIHYVPGKNIVVPIKPSTQQKPPKIIPNKQKQKEQEDQNAAFNDIYELMIAAA